jgi:peptidoglycan/LPS O-acetylase OafA/YrhL
LAIEEWFYLLFPGAFFLLATQLKSPDASFRQFFNAMLLFLLIPPALRFLAAWFDPSLPAGFTVVLRLDAIMYGVMLAYLKTWHVSIWAWLRKAWPLGIVGLLGGALLIKGVLIDPRLFTAQALIFSVLPLSFALVFPVCENLSQRTGWSACVIQRISVWSYSMYLAHMLVYDETRAFLNYDQSSDAGRVLIKLLALTLIFAVSALNYRYFERPLTNLREHFGGKKQRYCAVSRSAHTHPPS